MDRDRIENIVEGSIGALREQGGDVDPEDVRDVMSAMAAIGTAIQYLHQTVGFRGDPSVEDLKDAWMDANQELDRRYDEYDRGEVERGNEPLDGQVWSAIDEYDPTE